MPEFTTDDEILEDLFPSGKTPREHHAGFSHHVLREALFFSPEYSLSLISKQAPDTFIDALLQMLHGTNLEQYFDNIPGWEMQFEKQNNLGHPAVLIKMPSPQAPLECFYMCIVAVNEDELAYYTLEMSPDLPCSEAMFCAWNEEQTHLNFGEITNTQNNFIEHIRQRLAKSYLP